MGVNFKSVICEFYGMSGAIAGDGVSLFVRDRMFLYQNLLDGFCVLPNARRVESFSFHNHHLWYLQKGDDHIYCDKGVVSEFNSRALAEAYAAVSGKCFGLVFDDEDYKKSYVELVDLNKRVSHKFYGDISLCGYDGERIAGWADEKIVLFKDDFDEQWRYDVADFESLDGLYGYRQKAELYRDFVLVNLGMYKLTGVGKVVALSVADGHEVWTQQYHSDWALSFLVGDRYYVVAEKRLMVLEPETGRVINDKTLEIEGHFNCYPIDNFLVIWCEELAQIRVLDGATLDEIKRLSIPEPYMPIAANKAILAGNRLAIGLRRKSAVMQPVGEALLLLSLTDDNDSIEIEERPALLEMTLKLTGGEKLHVLTISEPDLYRLMRFASIRLFEIGCATGVNAWGPGPMVDKQHKGKFKLVIDPEGLPDDAEQQLNAWARDLEKDFKALALYPGAGKKYPFSIDITLSQSGN